MNGQGFWLGSSWQNTFTFDDAIKAHGMLRDALDVLSKSGIKPEHIKAIVEGANDAWNECMGLGDPDSSVASAVRVVMPLDYVPLLRMKSGIPAAYFVIRLIEMLTELVRYGSALDDDSQLRKAVQAAFNEFEKRRLAADKIQEGFGFDRSDAWAQMRKLEDRSGQVSPLMQEVANLAGRMYKAFQYQAIPSKCRDPQEVEGVETGGDFDRMLDDEAAAMGVDPEVMARIAEDRAHQYQMSGETIKNRGPLVIVVDESGSMHGHREVWAKACTVALARIALSEGRAVRCVHFSTGTHTHDVKPNNADDMRELAESHTGGGTDIEVALEVALAQVGNLAADDKEGADIVFVTDGLARYSEHHFIEMNTRGVQLWTVAIDVDIKAVAKESKNSRGYASASGHLFTYARAYVHIDDRTIRSNRDEAINVAVQLRDAALDNATRAGEAAR